MHTITRKVTVLICLAACFLAFARLAQASALAPNTHLLCPLKEYLSGAVGQSWQCHSAAQWDELSRQSLTFAALRQQLQYKLDRDDPQRVAHCGALCACAPPAPWHTQADRTDPRNQLITYYHILAYFDQFQRLPDLSACADYLLSSTYFYHADTPVKAGADAGPDADTLAALHQEMAYLVDQGWQHIRWRGVNALRQARVYQENARLDSARAAYARALETLPESDHRQKVRFTAQAYRGLAEIAAAGGDFDGALSTYEQSMRTHPEESAETLGAYIRLIYAQSSAGRRAQLPALLDDLDYEPLLVEAVEAIVAIPDVATARQLWAAFQARRAGSAYSMVAEALIAIAEEDFSRAERLYADAIAAQADIDPQIAARWATQLATLRRQQKDWAGGIEAQKTAVALAPAQHGYWYKLAVFYDEQGAVAPALSALDHALEISPDNPQYRAFRENIAGHKP